MDNLVDVGIQQPTREINLAQVKIRLNPEYLMNMAHGETLKKLPMQRRNRTERIKASFEKTAKVWCELIKELLDEVGHTPVSPEWIVGKLISLINVKGLQSWDIGFGPDYFKAALRLICSVPEYENGKRLGLGPALELIDEYIVACDWAAHARVLSES